MLKKLYPCKKDIFYDRIDFFLVRLKKYFYVLRPLLAIRYIEQSDNPPPVEFQKLVDSVAPESIIPGINRLLAIKRNSPELGIGDPVSEINEFVEKELKRHGDSFKGQGRPDILRGEDIRNFPEYDIQGSC